MSKLRVATTSLAGCFGCHMSFLDIDERLFQLLEHVAHLDRFAQGVGADRVEYQVIVGAHVVAHAVDVARVHAPDADVPGDDLAAIASGPTVGDVSTCADALAVLADYQGPSGPSISIRPPH